MKLSRRRFLHLAAAAGALPVVSRVVSVQTSAQTYPTRPITIVVPFGPGSATDTVARVIAQPLGSALKQSIVIEPKPGANGTIAAAQVARAVPDGHTLILSTNTPHSAAPSLVKNISYDPVKDFAPLSRIGSFTQVLVLHPDVPAKSIPELIAYARANPGRLSFASGNASGILAGETFKRWAGVDIIHVPYRTSVPALNDVLGGRVSMMFTDLTTGLPHVKEGALRALATTRLQRSALLPDLPSLHEAGVTGFNMDSWAGIFAPANLPRELVVQLNGELRKIIDDPDVKTRLGGLGFEAFSSTPE